MAINGGATGGVASRLFECMPPSATRRGQGGGRSGGGEGSSPAIGATLALRGDVCESGALWAAQRDAWRQAYPVRG